MKLDCEVNPKSSALQNKFVYLDLESVEKGELKKHQIIDKSDAPSRAQRVLSDNDVLFQCVRPYQQNNYLYKSDDSGIQWVASTGYAQLRVIKSNPSFIYQLLSTPSFTRKVIVRCTGSNYPAINSEDLSSIHYYTCSLPEQKRIAKLLALIDERIATQNKIIDKLQSLIKGLQDQLFKPLLQNRVRLGLIAKITNGSGDVQDAIIEYSEGLFPFFDRSDEIKFFKDYSFDDEAIIYAGEGSEFLPRYYKGKFAIHQRCYAITSFSSDFIPRYIYHYLQTQNGYFVRNAVGSTVPSLRMDCFQRVEIPIADIEIQNDIVTKLDTICEKVDIEKGLLTLYQEQKKFILDRMFI